MASSGNLRVRPAGGPPAGASRSGSALGAAVAALDRHDDAVAQRGEVRLGGADGLLGDLLGLLRLLEALGILRELLDLRTRWNWRAKARINDFDLRAWGAGGALGRITGQLDLRAADWLPDYRFLRSIQIYANGHDYDSRVAEVSITVVVAPVPEVTVCAW